ncbi:MAG: CHAT domain-containing protein, partial [Brasilonema sp.]
PEIQFSFRENVELVYRQLVDLLLQTSDTATENLIQDNIQQATQVIDSLQLAELENFLSCDLSERLESPQPTMDTTAATIYPIILEDRLEVILKLSRSEKFSHYTIPLPKAQVEQVLDNWRRELEQLYVSAEGLSLSEQVYNWLIRPIQEQLERDRVKTLVFVLDGPFRNVPMAALYDGQQYLIEKGYATAVIPSLQLLEPEPPGKRPLNTLAFGLSEVRKNFPAHQGFPPLTNVETELKQIQSQVSAQERLNQDFTSTTLQELVRSQPSSVLHLATHGQFSSNPEDTFILAWDKRLTIADLKTIFQSTSQESPQGIELLVLSACKTAEGDSRATLGLAGMAIESGARSTLASLWNINDRSTAQLMSDFYKKLANSETITKAEALRQAQIDLLKTSGYHSPRFWAPYILVGNWL